MYMKSGVNVSDAVLAAIGSSMAVLDLKESHVILARRFDDDSKLLTTICFLHINQRRLVPSAYWLDVQSQPNPQSRGFRVPGNLTWNALRKLQRLVPSVRCVVNIRLEYVFIEGHLETLDAIRSTL